MPVRTRARLRTAAAVAVGLAALAAAHAVKRFYSGASAGDLRPVLAPTTWLVEVVGGHRFDWTTEGYLDAEARFLVAPACAGLNFLVVAFCGLVLGFVRPSRPARQNLGILLASAAAAAAATLLANALRILVAIPLWTHRVAWGPLTGARLHELTGVVVFLGVLLLLHLAARRVAGTPLRLWVPLLPYAGVMLVVPLLRGAAGRPGFWWHAGVVAGALVVAGVASLVLRRPRPHGKGAEEVARAEGRAARPHPADHRRAPVLGLAGRGASAIRSPGVPAPVTSAGER